MKNLKRVSKTLFLNNFIRDLSFFPIITFLKPVKILSGEQLYHVRCFLRKYNISINRIKGSFLKLSLLKFFEQKDSSILKIGPAFFIVNADLFSFLESLKILKYIEIFFVPFFVKMNNLIINHHAFSEFLNIIKRRGDFSMYFFFSFPLFFFIFYINFFFNFLLYRKMFSEFFF